MPRYNWKAELVSFVPVVRTNRCINPSFETNTTSWAGSNTTLSQDTTIGFTGSASLKLVPTTTSNQNYAIYGTGTSDRPVASAGQSWAASVYARTGAGGNEIRLAGISLTWYNSGGGVLGSSTIAAKNINPNSWTRLEVVAVAPASTARVGFEVRYQYNNTSLANITYLDGALLEQSLYVKPYFDGSSTGPLPAEKNNVFAWTGTANASTSTNTCDEANFATPTSLDEIQEISITRGRRQIQDPFKAATATVTGRRPDLLPSVRIGDLITIRADNRSTSDQYTMFTGLIADFQVEYGELSSMDTWTMTCEDALATAGRSATSPTFSWSAGISTYEAARQAALSAGLTLTNLYATASGSTVSAQTLEDKNLLDVLNQLAVTEQGRVIGLDSGALGWVDRTAIPNTPTVIEFYDGLAGNTVPYNRLQFRSLADSFFEKVIVNPEGLTPQIGGAGFRTYQTSSYNVSTLTAKDLADYILATLNVNTAQPSTIGNTSELVALAPNDDAMIAARQAGQGIKATVQLRATQYTVLVEGSTVSATPDQTRFTFDVVSAGTLNFFVLDSTTQGVLDQDKLGF